MVDVESAVQIATSLINKVMPEYAALRPEVEEFELSSDGALWNVTFRAKNPDSGYPAGNVFFPYRDKVVQITTDNGELIAIRNPTYN